VKKRTEQKKSWFKARGYPHLTNKINPKNDRAEIFRLVKNPKRIAEHAFFPLFHKKIPERRYKQIGFYDNGKPKRGHSKNGESTKKLRPLHYATHIDTQIYAYYSNEIIQKKYEGLLKQTPELSKCITAYRRIPIEAGTESPCKSSIHFAKEAFDYIKNRGECCAMAFDISSFFTNLNHKTLKKAWCKLLGTKSLPKDHYNVFKSITNYSYILIDELRTKKNQSFDEQQLAYNRQKGVQAFFESPQALRKAIQEGEIRVYKNQYHDNNGKSKKIRGIPQGLPISAMLANLYLLEFDKAVLKKVTDLGGLYRRYSDDIVVVCNEAQQKEISEFVFGEIEKYDLEIQAAKTEVSYFRYVEVNGKRQLKVFSVRTKKINGEIAEIEQENYPFAYLGFDFYGYKTLIKSKNLAKFYRRMKQAVKSKAKRIESVKEKYLISNPLLFKGRLYRVYSYKGQKPRKWKKDRRYLEYNDDLGYYAFETIEKDNPYRGNYLNYVKRAAKIMNEPGIERQLRRHFKILKKYIAEHIDAPNVRY
jgi:hypothetical protein